jgi:hypothetical protein
MPAPRSRAVKDYSHEDYSHKDYSHEASNNHWIGGADSKRAFEAQSGGRVQTTPHASADASKEEWGWEEASCFFKHAV